MWTRDPERLRAFYESHFGASAGARYASATRPGFTSYFLTFPGGGARLEIMCLPALVPARPEPAVGYAHLAISLGSRAAVDELATRLAAAGLPLHSGPRQTGDGYYEAVLADPDGNLVEITV